MTTIDSRLSFIDNSGSIGELYRNFYNPTWKKHYYQRDYGDEYVQNPRIDPHSNLYRGLVAGGVLAVVGGVGTFVGRKNLTKYIEKLNMKKYADNLKEQAKGVKSGFTNVVNGYFVVDKSKDMGIMMTLRAIDSGFAKIKLGFFKPGEWLTNISRFSLRMFTGRNLKVKYNSIDGGLKSALKDLSDVKKPFSEQEKQLLGKTGKVLEDLQDSLGVVREGRKVRQAHIEEEVKEKHIKHFLENYFIKVPEKFFDGKQWKKNFGEVVENWKKVFKPKNAEEKIDLDVLRKGWEETRVGLEHNLKSSTGKKSGKTFGECIGALDNEIASLEKTGGNSKKLKGFVDKLKGVRKKVDEAVNFEVDGRGDGYAGRAIDLYGGGGIQETFAPLAIGGIIAHSSIKNREEDDTPADIGKRFMKTGGVEFLGGLGAMGYMNYWRGINGPKAILAGLGTALGLNLIMRLYEKITGDKITGAQPKVI